jgi:hypothetical protein
MVAVCKDWRSRTALPKCVAARRESAQTSSGGILSGHIPHYGTATQPALKTAQRLQFIHFKQVMLNSALKPVPTPFKKPDFLTFLVKNPSHIFILGVPESVLGIVFFVLGVPFFSLGAPESVLGVAKIISAKAFSHLAIAGFGSAIVVKGLKGVNS